MWRNPTVQLAKIAIYISVGLGTFVYVSQQIPSTEEEKLKKYNISQKDVQEMKEKNKHLMEHIKKAAGKM